MAKKASPAQLKARAAFVARAKSKGSSPVASAKSSAKGGKARKGK